MFFLPQDISVLRLERNDKQLWMEIGLGKQPPHPCWLMSLRIQKFDSAVACTGPRRRPFQFPFVYRARCSPVVEYRLQKKIIVN